jgi:hypothetical protein
LQHSSASIRMSSRGMHFSNSRKERTQLRIWYIHIIVRVA